VQSKQSNLEKSFRTLVQFVCFLSARGNNCEKSVTCSLGRKWRNIPLPKIPPNRDVYIFISLPFSPTFFILTILVSLRLGWK